MPNILFMLQFCVTFCSYRTVPLSPPAGYEEWNQDRWCAPCLTSSPVSPRSSRFLPAKSSRCSVLWMNSGCLVTKMASQVTVVITNLNQPTFVINYFYQNQIEFYLKCPIDRRSAVFVLIIQQVWVQLCFLISFSKILYRSFTAYCL